MTGNLPRRFGPLPTALALAAALVAAPAAGQPGGQDDNWTAPRTPWGDPDLQGLWNNATTTPLQRPEALGEKAFLTDAEAAERDRVVGAERNTDREPRAGDPGTYNEFWWERGRTVANNRTSLIFDPPDGRLPALSPDGERRAAAAAARRRQRGEYDSWTDRPLAERCIIYRGIPAFPTGYNNNYRIAQTPDHVAILQEHIHEIRIIPLDGRPHANGRIRQWLGDSRGRWEGETLVVETTNFSEQALLRNVNGDPSEALHVVERYTRVAPGMIDYEFTVSDPATWTRPWSGSLPLTAFEGPLYEYACHEGNYALENVLAGARAQERESPPPLTTANGEWPSYGGDAGHRRYSPLDQIDASNFSELEIAWRFRTDNLGPAPEFKLEGTPLMADGVLYATAGTRRAVAALDAASGELLWVHSEHEGARAEAAPRLLSGRGLAYWTDGEDARILYVTLGFRLVALDARTGRRVPGFGEDGRVDLKAAATIGDGRPIDPVTGEIGLHATPTVARDVVIVGGTFADAPAPRTHNNTKGLVQAFDVRTGRRLWNFHTVPRPGEFGAETWLNDSWGSNGNNGVWTQISADPEEGIVYLPVETPSGDYYGGHRPGDNLFGESLVAVDLLSGERKWHFQLVHHPIWGFDMASPPILADITVDGRPVKAVAQPGKQAFLYVFDRVSGEPVWPIEERPVPRGDVPGEWYSPTQPFPTKPPAYDRQGSSIDDLIDFTPELRAEAVELVSRYRLGPLFTPPVVSNPEGPIATLGLGAGSGGTNWPGGGYDPETHILYVPSRTAFYSWELIPTPGPEVSDMRYVKGTVRHGVGHGGLRDLNLRGLPLAKPPWGRLSAIDLDRGEILWQTPHGETPDRIRNHPALRGLDIPRTGEPCIHLIGPLVTKTLVILGECGYHRTEAGRGAMLRAYDKASGQEVGAVFMPAPQSGSPMTYEVDGRQYIVLAVSGRTHPGEYIAFRLPARGR